MLWTSFLALVPLHGARSYDRFELHELAACAEQVVVGTIEALQETTFDLAVERAIVGAPGPSLRLERFVDWTCAGRYAPYRTGQRVLLFLGKGHVLGAGDEGEMPLVGNGVLVPYPVRGSRFVERRLDGGEFFAAWVPLEDVAEAVPAFRESFSFGRNEPHGFEVGGTHARVAEASLEALRARSAFARELVEDTLRCPCYGGERVREPRPAGVLGLEHARGHEPGRQGIALQSFPALPAGQGAEVLVGDPWNRCVTRLRLGAEDCAALERLEMPARDGREWSRFDGPEYGRALAPLGDLDGDGHSELVVAAPSSASAHFADREHEAALFLSTLPGDGPARLLREIGPGEAPELVDGCAFGLALCALDLDGDGRSELIVARRPHAKWRTQTPGSLAVLFLEPDGAVGSWSAIGADAAGHGDGADFGAVLASPGDLDGDGVPDLVLGEPSAEAGGPYRGGLRVLFLTARGELHGWTRLDATSSPALALEDGDELGAALAAPGDLDGDGIPDLVAAGARALWTLLLAPDGSVRWARRQALETLLPGAVEPLSLSRLASDGHGATLLCAVRFGSADPREIGLVRLRAGSQGLALR